jgi:exonuclease III
MEKQLIDITQRYKIDILAVQEMRWVGQSILEKKERTIYYSCHKSLHQFGTGFIINRKQDI